jgi:hypothetical protein
VEGTPIPRAPARQLVPAPFPEDNSVLYFVLPREAELVDDWRQAVIATRDLETALRVDA